MIPRKLRRAIQAGVPPRPIATIDAERLVVVPPAVTVGIGRSLSVALSLLPTAPAGPHLLIPDPRASGERQTRDINAVVEWLSRAGDVSTGVTESTGAGALRRRSNVVDLGRNGWRRVIFGQRSLILNDVDLPAELFTGQRNVLLSRPSGRGCLSAWAALAHPNTQLRASVSGHAPIELAMGVTADYLLLGEDNGRTVAIHTTTAITAELAARAIERLGPRRRGFESVGPWEEPSIQHLAELGEATPAVMRLAVRLAVEDNAGERIGREIAEMLGWTVQIDSTKGEGNDR
jgi:hypothetical protein